MRDEEQAMDLTKLTLSEFMCDGRAKMADAHAASFEDVGPHLGSYLGAELRVLGEGYSIHEFSNQPGDVILLHNREPVGCYWGELLAICPKHQGRKLSVPLILAAVPHRPTPSSRKLSVAGKKALEMAWKVANQQEQDPWP